MAHAGESPRTKVYVEEDGCDRRQLDIGTIRRYLEANGYDLVNSPGEADRIIVATCAFKKKEEDASVERVRALRKHGTDILVYGCLPDIAAERYTEFADLPFVAPRDISSIAQHFEGPAVPFAEVEEAHEIDRRKRQVARARRVMRAGLSSPEGLLRQSWALGPSRIRRLLIKVEDPYYLFVSRGCRGKCSYCAIRRPIGGVVSKPVESVVAEYRQGRAAGYRTFIVLGDDPGCYGLDAGGSLPELLAALFSAAEEDASVGSSAPEHDGEPVRFRIREIHPKHLVAYGDDLLALPGFGLIEEVLCPLQSGSDRILELMNREHTADDLITVVRQISERYPSVTLSTQVIVGFPSETEEEFVQTLRLVRDAAFDSVVVFPYHDKEGTGSARLEGKIPEDEIQRRLHRAVAFFRKAGLDAYYSCP